MFVDRDYLYTLSLEFNETLFYGSLPYIVFFPLHTYTLGGICIVDYGYYGEPYYLVGVTDYYDLSDRQIRKVLIHELVHVYLHTRIGNEGLCHNEPFLDELWRVNCITGLSVEVCADVNAPKRHNFFTAWLKAAREGTLSVSSEALEDMPPLYSSSDIIWHS